MEHDFRCQYQSTNCENARSRKDNGELHGLCAFHRSKANESQRRWSSRHRDGVFQSLLPRDQVDLRGPGRITPTLRAIAKTRRREQRRLAHSTISGSATLWRQQRRDTRDATRPHERDEVLVAEDGALLIDDEDLHALMALVLDHNQARHKAQELVVKHDGTFA